MRNPSFSGVSPEVDLFLRVDLKNLGLILLKSFNNTKAKKKEQINHPGREIIL